MKNHLVKILLIEDNLADARLLQEFLKEDKSQDFTLVHTQKLQEAFHELNRQNYDVILLDLTLPDSQGLSSLTSLVKPATSIPIVVLTNINDEDLAIRALREGAQDYLVKRQVKPDLLIRSLRYAIERKQVLERLRLVNQVLENTVDSQTDKLVKSEEIIYLKSEFVSMFSHDIRNPLNTIYLATQLLQKPDDKLTIEKKNTHLQIIRSAIKNMSNLLDEASLIGKVDSAKLQCELGSLNVESFCRQLVQEVQLTAVEKSVEIEFISSGDFSQTVWDKNLLRHILDNLLNNAIKYSLPYGKVLFELTRREKTAIFQLHDQGIGISNTDQKYLFQAFYRGGNVGKISGSGLGLAIVKKCVDLYGGEIVFNSQAGIGTVFTVTLPLTKL